MTTLDCSGLSCPLPVVRLSKAVHGLPMGETLELIATDPGAPKDVQAWSRQTGNTVLQSKQESGKFRFVIQKTV